MDQGTIGFIVMAFIFIAFMLYSGDHHDNNKLT
jgi:hypothetical protein